MLAYPPVEIRTQIDKETWDNVVASWTKLLNAKVDGYSEFLESYVRNASPEDDTVLRATVFSLILNGELKSTNVETLWDFVELYGPKNVSSVTDYILNRSNTSIPKLRRLAIHYLQEDHLNVIEPLAVLFSNGSLVTQFANDDWFRELDRVGGETAHRIIIMTQQAMQATPEKVEMLIDLFPQLSSGNRARQLLLEYHGDVEALTAHLLEHPIDATPPPESHGANTNANASTSTSMNTTGASASINTNDTDAIPRNFHFGKKPNKGKLERATSSHLETTLRLLYQADEDERDDTYDDADTHEETAKTSAAVDKIEQYLWYLYNREPKEFSREQRKTPSRQKLKNKIDWSDEQIEGWASMLVRQPQRKTALEDKYFGMRDDEVALLNEPHTQKKPHAPQTESQPKPQSLGQPQSQQKSKRDQKRKEQNKARQANHNRKSGHAKKMNNV